MSLWLMLFGLISPIAVIVQGAIAEMSSIRVVLVATAAVSLAATGRMVGTGRHRAIDPPSGPESALASN